MAPRTEIGATLSEARPILTFDCYGTLVDWERGIAAAFAEIAAESGAAAPADRVLELYARIEPEVEAGEYRSYREVLGESARRIAAELGLTLPRGGERFLADSLPRWPPFPDTRRALERLAAGGWGLGILSNVDDRLLAATLDEIGVRFELLVTAERVRAYKPAHAHFHTARREIGERPWTHVAQSLFHDVAPARELGIPVLWINRQAEPRPADLPPEAELPDLAALAERLLGAGP